jgi:AcrR family transcriptional regulator
MVLQDSLIELMEKKPITKITIKELCENADVNRTTFYAYYSDQYDLLHKIEKEALSWVKESLINLIGKTDKDERMKVLEKIFQYVIENSRHLKILMSEQGDIDFQKQIFTLIYQQCGISTFTAANVELGISEDHFIFAVSGSVGLLQHWLKNGINRSAREMAEAIYNMAANSGDFVIPAEILTSADKIKRH